LLRQLRETGLRERPTLPSETPSEEELLAILGEKARAGNVAAVRTLLARDEAKDPAPSWPSNSLLRRADNE
jgi:hypothetical protein